MATEPLIYLEGTGYDLDDLTFREQRELRARYRELMEDPNADPGDAANCDLLPILVFMVRRRDDPAFTLDQALDLKIEDIVTPPADPPTRPAKRAAK